MAVAYTRYFDANIPLEYWDLKMNDFNGPVELNNVYQYAISDLGKIYNDGKSVCLCGNHGLGKTLILSNILKQACQKNYSCLYTTLSDAVNILILSNGEQKFLARQELTMVDFLVVDEFDSRFISSEASADLFGRTLEHILRTRQQNKLPVFFCSNSPNPIETFTGPIKQSIESLMYRVKMVPIMGKDYRKNLGVAI